MSSNEQRGKKRAYLAQPKADCGQTWPSLALSWAEQEFTWLNLGVTCAELGPVGSKLDAISAYHVQLGPVWGHLVPKLAPRQHGFA